MSFSHLSPLLQRYRTKGLLLDTNLLLLYVTGLVAPEMLAHFKPVANHGFGPDDFDLLDSLVRRFTHLVTTPHILTEVSNHSDKLKGEAHASLFLALRALVMNAEKMKEVSLASANIVPTDDFLTFGLTDAGILQLAPGNHLVATVDFPLAGRLRTRSVDVVNFNHLRDLAWRSG